MCFGIYIYTKGFKNKVLLLKTLHIKSYSLSKFQYVIFLIKEESNWDGPALVLSILQSWSLSCLRKTQSLRAAARALLSDLPLVQIPQQQSLLLYSFIYWGGTRLLTGKFRSGSNLSKGISSSGPPHWHTAGVTLWHTVDFLTSILDWLVTHHSVALGQWLSIAGSNSDFFFCFLAYNKNLFFNIHFSWRRTWLNRRVQFTWSFTFTWNEIWKSKEIGGNCCLQKKQNFCGFQFKDLIFRL